MTRLTHRLRQSFREIIRRERNEAITRAQAEEMTRKVYDVGYDMGASAAMLNHASQGKAPQAVRRARKRVKAARKANRR